MKTDIRNQIDTAILNAIVYGVGLPCLGEHAYTQNVRKHCDEDDLFGFESCDGASREDVVERIRGIDNLAAKHGIEITRTGLTTRTHTNYYDYEKDRYYGKNYHGQYHFNHFRREYSFSIISYRVPDLLKTIEKLGNMNSFSSKSIKEEIKESIGERKAEAAFSYLDEIYDKYAHVSVKTVVSEITGLSAREREAGIYKRYKLLEKAAGKQTTIVPELFGLTEEKTYFEMENLAANELDEKLNEIREEKSFRDRILGDRYRTKNIHEKQKKAIETYKESLTKIRTIRQELLEECDVAIIGKPIEEKHDVPTEPYGILGGGVI